MNEPVSSEDSYLTCEINGSHYILQPVSNSPEAFINMENLDEGSMTFPSSPDAEPPAESEGQNEDEEQTVPLVYLGGQIYAVQDGQLQELDIAPLPSEVLDLELTLNSQKSSVIPNVRRNPQEYLLEPSPTPEDSPQEISKLEPDPDSEFHDELVLEDSEDDIHDLQDKELNANDFIEVVTAFKCKICPYTTQDRSELLKHFKKTHTNSSTPSPLDPMKIDDVKLLYMCGECSNCFPSMETCREHMIKDHQLTDNPSDSPTLQPLASDLVEAETKSNSKAKTPKLIENREKNVRCKYRGCVQKFSSKEIMQAHASCHVDSGTVNSYRCSICQDAKFVKWRDCLIHLWKKHQVDIDLLSCPICKTYKTAAMMKLSSHMRVHSDDRDFECSHCGKRFKQSSQLRNHRIHHLDRKSMEIPRWYTSKTCEMCGKTYADAKCLRNHMQAVHSKLRPYVCNICGHSSSRKANLQMHLRQHTGDKPFNCDLCDFKTGDHNSLRRHIMRHTGVRPYKCPHCSYSAIQSNSYKNHLKAKHPESAGIFKCDLCSFRTVKRESYLEHLGGHEKGLIKATVKKENKDKDTNGVEVFPGNIAAAQLIYSCLGAFSKDGNTIEANLMSSSTSADGTSQTITIQIPSKHLEGSLPISDSTIRHSTTIDQEDDETMHCFLKIPREEEENIDTGGITIPAELDDTDPHILNVES
ncbi:zinc finger protein 62 homolog [Fopius arisanus]|uniref:Zinc finger protein 62 homolog n=1 Tax=Fopius arisanus TaxID=64838 RepID=A0A9R1U7R9_9HYME|nr:PREDICTED: zinc finger protein 62 homolog [Fopius arisanus]